MPWFKTSVALTAPLHTAESWGTDLICQNKCFNAARSSNQAKGQTCLRQGVIRGGSGSAGSSFSLVGINPAWLQENLQTGWTLEKSDGWETQGWASPYSRQRIPIKCNRRKIDPGGWTSGHSPGKACSGDSSQGLGVGEGFGQVMEWTVRGKGDFQPERFVPVKEERLRLLL